jgi:hypothetical protein
MLIECEKDPIPDQMILRITLPDNSSAYQFLLPKQESKHREIKEYYAHAFSTDAMINIHKMLDKYLYPRGRIRYAFRVDLDAIAFEIESALKSRMHQDMWAVSQSLNNILRIILDES